MYKTRLGISVGLMGALIYFVCLFGSYLASILLAGYVLMFEGNEWLKRSAVKAVALMVFFSFVSALVGLLPETVGLLSEIVELFNGNFSYYAVSQFCNILNIALDIYQTILFIILGVKALNQGTVPVPFVDSLIQKYI